jgi:thiamine biosynthesis protein ThiS
VRVRLRWLGRTEEIELAEGSSVLDLLAGLGVCREMVVVSVNGRIVPEEKVLREGDEVVVHPIVTGG